MAMTDMTEAFTAVRESQRALTTVISAVENASEEDLGAPSLLPDWTRGHVLAHIDGITRALARQLEYAARGSTTEVYDGGRSGRAAAIEAGATRSAAEHVAALSEAQERHRRLWPGEDSQLWHVPVTYREGTVVDLALAWWRETNIHLVDLDWGVTAQEAWSQPLQEHLLDFLSVRLPPGPQTELDGFEPSVRYVVGAEAAHRGEPAVTVTGPLASLTGWLAGRTVHPLPIATSAGQTVDLPELGPWPAR